MVMKLPEPDFVQMFGEIHMLKAPLIYFDELEQKRHKVPAGFQSDLASVPRIIPALIVNDMGAITYPSFLHDFMYEEKYTSRSTADRIFRQFAIERGLATPRAWIAWAGVRLNLYQAYKWNRNA